MKAWITTFLLMSLCVSVAEAYPEFQRYSKKVSGRAVNCAMCHKNSDGPEGIKPGQIGSLNDEELKALGVARQAFNPGNHARNPVLNDFGNAILNQLGKKKLMVIRRYPERLAPALSKASDLDGDGIPDAEEFLDGTHPLNPLNGHPWKLFKHNLAKNRFHLVMIILATGLGMYGLQNMLLFLMVRARKEED